MLRLALGARWTNRLCRRPPLPRLAAPGALARLSTSREALAVEEAELRAAGAAARADGAGADAELCGFSVDLADCFYQFKTERMASYFGLDFTASVSEIESLFDVALTEAHDEIEGGRSEVRPDETLEACFLGMAMGWSWALFFCNETISDVMRAALTAHGPPTTLVGDRQQPAALHPWAPAMAPICRQREHGCAWGRAGPGGV